MTYGLAEAREHRVQDSFEHEGWSIQEWRGLLAIRASEQGHRSIHRLLERALAGQRRPAPGGEPWRERVTGGD